MTIDTAIIAALNKEKPTTSTRRFMFLDARATVVFPNRKAALAFKERWDTHESPTHVRCSTLLPQASRTRKTRVRVQMWVSSHSQWNGWWDFIGDEETPGCIITCNDGVVPPIEDEHIDSTPATGCPYGHPYCL